MKNIIIIALVIFFNDFLGALITQVGLLALKLGSLLSSIPEIF